MDRDFTKVLKLLATIGTVAGIILWLNNKYSKSR